MLYQRVLITGANGLVGQELVSQLSRHGEYDVLATARDAAPRFTNASCGYTPLDITDDEALGRVFDDFAPSVVINCAAMTQVDECEQNREACWKVNAEAIEQLARHCRLNGTRLIQLSSDFVFDGENGPYREDDRPNPINFYGRSKLASENAIREAGLGRWTIVRTVLVFGTGHNLTRTNVSEWVINNLKNDEVIRVVNDQHRTPTYVADLAQGIERIVRHKKTGIYHLSGSELMSVYDFAQEIASTFDLDHTLIRPIASEELGQTAPRPPRTGFIILKAASEIGFKPRPMSEALRDLGRRLGLPCTTPSS